MNNIEIPTNYRISETTKKLMIAVGIIFDLLPILSILIMVFVVFQLTGGTMIGKSFQTASEAEKWCAELRDPNTGFWRTRIAAFYCGNGSAHAREQFSYGIIGAVLSDSLVLFFLGPIIYTATSIISTFMAYLLFFFWFGFKRVNMWSFNNEKRILINFGTFIVENIPGLDLLPGTTFMVWVHIRLSRNEDEEKAKEGTANIKSKLANAKIKPSYA